MSKEYNLVMDFLKVCNYSVKILIFYKFNPNLFVVCVYRPYHQEVDCQINLYFHFDINYWHLSIND